MTIQRVNVVAAKKLVPGTLKTDRPELLHDLGPNGNRYSYRIIKQWHLDKINEAGKMEPLWDSSRDSRTAKGMVTYLSSWPEPAYTGTGEICYILRVSIPSVGAYQTVKQALPISKLALSVGLPSRQMEKLCRLVESNRLKYLNGKLK